MYEHKREKIVPLGTFYQRVLKNILIAIMVMLVCLIIGLLGYHYTADIPWLDAFHNAAMILSGMGPVVDINTEGGKWFSSFYALFSGVVFITNMGIILAPAIHRLLHRLNVEEE
jgi:hypothetical protein